MRKLLLSLTFFTTVCFAEISIEQAWVRMLPPTAKNTAAYMIIKNSSDQPVSLIKAQSAKFMMVHSHQTKMIDGHAMMKMTKLTVPAKGQVELKPGGKHLMLMNRKSSLSLKEKVKIKLLWDNGTTSEVNAEVKAQ